MIDPHSTFLLIAGLIAVLGLIVLIAFFKLNPFLTLFVVSLALALAAGMPFTAGVHSFELGMGATLGHIAIIVALGTMLGKMLAESGGADQIAHTMIRVFGHRRIAWAMMAIGLVVGLPCFFEVGFVLLIPIAYTVARRTGKSLVEVALPLLAGLSVDQGLTPPHPAAVMAVSIFKAGMGRTMVDALLVGLPTAILAGPVYTRLIAPHIELPAENPMAEQFVDHGAESSLPGFNLTLFTLLLPVFLLALGSIAGAAGGHAGVFRRVLGLFGNDDLALLLGVLVSFQTLGRMRGFQRQTILQFSQECLAPTALITLLVGAGGGFGRVLQDSGVAHAIVGLATRTHVSLLFLVWLLAAVMRLATGSATVAMVTAAGMVAPVALTTAYPHPELLAIAAGAGSLIFSHVNDGGFWLVKQYFNMSVPQTLKTWSICETILSVTALLLTLALSLLH